MTGPLAGIHIVELAHEIAGPYAAKLFVDLGAEVTKIEPPAGDPLRRWGPFPGGVPDRERCGLFEYLNAGKRGATLDFAPGRHHRSAPPTLGQHNDEILRGLGLSADEAATLRAERVIGERVLNA